MKCGIHYPHMGMSCSFCLKPHPHHNFPSTSVGTGLIRHTGLAALANLALSPSATGPTQTLCSIRGHPRRRSDQRVHVRNSGPRPRIAGPAAAGHHRHRGDRTPQAPRRPDTAGLAVIAHRTQHGKTHRRHQTATQKRWDRPCPSHRSSA